MNASCIYDPVESDIDSMLSDFLFMLPGMRPSPVSSSGRLASSLINKFYCLYVSLNCLFLKIRAPDIF